jgi:ABC-2 type transport system ATP-binding protein
VEPLITLRNVHVSRGANEILRGVTLSVSPGEISVLLGPNGAGKTTVMDTLLGFCRPTSGSVTVAGFSPIREHHQLVRLTGSLLQRGAVWAPMSPREVLTLTASYYDTPRSPDELLETLGLSDVARRPWRRLSGGEQQRTLLGLALLGRPRVLALDEPTSAVDPEGRSLIRDVLRAEAGRGVAILFTTHELHEAEKIADTVTILDQGQVVAHDTLAALTAGTGIVCECDGEPDAESLRAILGYRVYVEGVTVTSEHATATELAGALAALHLNIVTLRTRSSLEEQYLRIVSEAHS